MATRSKVSVFGKIFRTLFAKRSLNIEADYQREVFFVATLGVTIYYMTALLSFSPLDPSWIAESFPAVKPTNLAGTIGAHVSGYLLFYLGIGAYLMPVPFLTSASLVITKIDPAKSNIRLLGWLMAILVATSLASSNMNSLIFDDYPLPSGGVIGGIISTFLLNTFGETGSNIILATGGICSVILILKKGLVVFLTKASIFYTRKFLVSTKENIVSMAKHMFTSDDEEYVEELSEPVLKVSAVEPYIEEDIPPGEDLELEPQVMEKRSFSIKKPEIEKDEKVEKEESPFKNLHSLFKKPEKEEQEKAYKTPPVELFNKTDKAKKGNINKKELESTAALLVATLKDFNVEGRIIGYQPGPVVTVYEFQPNTGIKLSKIVGLMDDLALALRVDSVFINPVKGKRALGIQVPNEKREVVYLGDIIESPAFQDSDDPLTFVIGKSLNGDPVCANLAATPHLLVAGATGSGKSVGINSLLCSILMKSSPDDVRMILVDPKMLELSIYDGIPHLLMPVITEPPKANLALKWAVNEMERRYKLMQNASVRNIGAFNNFWEGASKSQKNDFREKMEDEEITRLPYILIVIDELADLMLCAPKEIESIIQRLAQKARASGIHMVLATQRPSVDIITGVIKANLPTRIAFQVVSKHDSRTILDTNGADKLLGKGDMLFQKPGVSQLERIQGTLISDEEVVNLVAAIKKYSDPSYDDNLIGWIEEEANRIQNDTASSGSDDGEEDAKYDEAFNIAQGQGSISASFLQRSLKIGYNRAARIVESMERQGLVAKADGSKPRKWLGPNSMD